MYVGFDSVGGGGGGEVGVADGCAVETTNAGLEVGCGVTIRRGPGVGLSVGEDVS